MKPLPTLNYITQMTVKGKRVANHLLITTAEGVYLKSYNSLVAFKGNDGKIILDTETWDYSNTTGKYRNHFLGETKEQTEQKIKSGEYQLRDLN